MPTVTSINTANPFNLKLGTRIVVELTGTIVGQDSRIGHFVIQPDDGRSSSIHVREAYLYPEDSEPTFPAAGDAEPEAEDSIESGLVHVALALTMIANRLGPNADAETVHGAITSRVESALEWIKQARDFEVAMIDVDKLRAA